MRAKDEPIHEDNRADVTRNRPNPASETPNEDSGVKQQSQLIGPTAVDRPVFLVWAPSSPRAENLAHSLSAKVYLLSYKFKRKIYSPIKYPLLFAKSISILARLNPKIVICQEPSIFCTLTALIYRYFIAPNSKIVIDAHTAAFEPPWSRIKYMHRKLLAKAAFVIVTNESLRRRLAEEYKVKRCFVLADKIPNLPSNKIEKKVTRIELPDPKGSSFRVVVICSFAPDEPVKEIIEAAALSKDVTFYITGDFEHTKFSGDAKMARTKLMNAVFTGYLPKSDYVALLSQADAVVVLTDRNDTMLSGAQEALSLEKPIITSCWPVLRQYFDRGTIHVNNKAAEIAEAIRIMKNNLSQFQLEISELKSLRQREWTSQFNELKHFLGQGIDISHDSITTADANFGVPAAPDNAKHHETSAA